MTSARPEPLAFHFSGGAVCLDFANTRSWRPSDHPVERLTAYPALVAWGEQAGLLTRDRARRLLQAAGRRPREAAAVLAGSVAARETVYRIFSAIADGARPDPADLAALNRRLPEALGRLRLTPRGRGFALDWPDDGEALDALLRPVWRSAADLLTGDQLGRVRTCAAADCGWVFVDATRNASRRWCDMRMCGNRAKVRRYYRRAKRAASRRAGRR